MEEAKIDRAVMGRLAKALGFICGPDHPTTVALKAVDPNRRNGRPVLMQWTTPTTGIAMCQIAGADAEPRESTDGHKRTPRHRCQHFRSGPNSVAKLVEWSLRM